MFLELEFVLLFSLLLYLVLQFTTQKRPKKFPPGPIGIPFLGYLPFLTLPAPIGLSKLSKKYGNICSMYFANVPVVIISGPELIHKLLKDDRFLGRPRLRAFTERSFGKLMGLTFGEGPHWYELRKFTVRHLKNVGYGSSFMESLIKYEINELIMELRKEVGNPIFITNKIEIPLINALWNIVTGKRFSHSDPNLMKAIHIFHQQFLAFEKLGPVFFVEWFTRLFPIISGWNNFISSGNELYAFLKVHIASHKEQLDTKDTEEEHENLITAYLKEIRKTNDKDSVFYGEEGEKSLLVALLDLFSAGMDPPVAALSWSILYLMVFPKVQEKLYSEIQNIIGNERSPSLLDRPKMPYLQSFIAETFRLGSITSVGFIRAPTQDVEFEGYVIPKGTMILGNTWELHHDPKFWMEPESFNPERFISPTSGEYMKNNENLLPFAAGKKSCIGKNLANDELFLFISSLVQNFRFLIDPNSDPPNLEGIHGTLTKPKPYKVILSPRLK